MVVPCKICLKSIQSLACCLPTHSGATRAKIYAAVEVLLVDLVQKLEAEQCEDEQVFVQFGELLDAMNRMVSLKAGSAAEERALGQFLVLAGHLDSCLVEYRLAS